ncbi:MAG: hypothetical protein Q8922_15570 [Bacteroidota bacterium]|nr:hypothetical protein [Bacteroidota bacterium]MDP4234636.1 hypothetical protein [Bacteroidota bacterium]MDP4243765.1 hypothetical protein [Bacteroidota bacterium]MDP4289333.1 hypothetical protein [Bacteroidota bacterium]
MASIAIELKAVQAQEFKPVSLFWKDEDEDADGEPIGPLYCVNERGVPRKFEEVFNGGTDGLPLAKWLLLSGAEEIAERLGLDLETF